MAAIPWQSFAVPESDKEYLALLSYLPLNTFRAVPKFLRYAFQLRRQLADSEGLIGYSLDAKLQSREFWTLSVWDDEEALMRFVARNPHGRIMTDLVPHMGQTKFTQWKTDGASVPPGWTDARRRMREQNTGA